MIIPGTIVDWDESPRIITIPSPIVEVTIADLQDTLLDIEDDEAGMVFPHLRNTSGGEWLDETTRVGWTMELQNAKLAFEARPGPNYVQCRIAGGNIVAVDENGDTMSPIQPTAFVSVLVTASSSATTTEQGSIQYSSFNGGVTIDVINGTSGVEFPQGTPQSPVNNLADALSIATERGFPTIYVTGDLEIDSGGDYSGMQFIGNSTTKSELIISAAANVANCEFYEATVSGTLDGNAQLKDCRILDLNYINGVVERCLLGPGTIVLGGGAEAHFIDCWSGIATEMAYPTIDCGGTGQTLAMRNYNGEIKIVNKHGTENVTIDLGAGSVLLDETVTAGNIVVRGVGTLIDNSTADNVDSTTLLNSSLIAETVYQTVGQEIQQASFNSCVTIDVINGVAGTAFPIGTHIQPVNNLADAVSIAAERGLERLQIHGNFTFQATDNISNFIIVGEGAQTTTLTFTTGCILAYCHIEYAECVGLSFGITRYEHCSLSDYGSSGLIPSSSHVIMRDCRIGGTLTIPANFTGIVEALNCASDNAIPEDVPNIDFNGAGLRFITRGFSGCLMITNCTNTEAQIALDIDSAGIILDTSVTAGSILVRGVGRFVNNSSVEVNTDGFISNPLTANAVWDAALSAHLEDGSMGDALNNAGAAGNPWDAPVSGSAAPGTMGELVSKKLLKFATWIGLK